eukprot:13269722-Heterocapsa_arctica.AAC.1
MSGKQPPNFRASVAERATHLFASHPVRIMHRSASLELLGDQERGCKRAGARGHRQLRGVVRTTGGHPRCRGRGRRHGRRRHEGGGVTRRRHRRRREGCCGVITSMHRAFGKV